MTATFDLARIGDGLPFAAALGELQAHLAGGACVVQAEPGAGKTTLVPPAVSQWCLEHGRTGRVIVTQPRRVATRAAARRLAQLSGTTLGDLVGYSVRGEARVSAATRVEFLTPGLLLRRLLHDPGLDGVEGVILDEVHERSLDSDLLAAMLRDVRDLREDFLLVAMSATVDTADFAELLGEDAPAPVIISPSHPHPMDIHWAPGPARMDNRGVSRAFLEHVAACTLRALAAADARPEPGLPGADALVFLPGVREVETVAEALRERLNDVGVFTLHGRLTSAEQDQVTKGREPSGRRRVVVSTALAESSLTVPGVRIVVDAGLAREPRRDALRQMTGLVTLACSRASAVQRAGRAARLGPGLVVRCYDEYTFTRMPEHVTPEILMADLTPAALTLAAWGTPRGTGLRMLTQPPAAAMDAGMATLQALDAITVEDRLTPTGEALSRIPTDPRLGRALIEGTHLLDAATAARIVAALSDDLRSPTADAARAIADLSGPARARWQKESTRLERIATQFAPDASSERPPVARSETPTGIIAALAYPERIARRVGDDVYLMASGTRAALPSGSALNQQEWLVVIDVARTDAAAGRGTGAVIRLATSLQRESVEQLGSALLTEELQAEWRDGKVTARLVKALGAIELSSSPTRVNAEDARETVLANLTRQGVEILNWTPAATALRNRLAFVHHHLGDPWPAVDDTALLSRIEEWFGPELQALAQGQRVSNIDLVEPLRRLLPWPQAHQFDELAPERLTVPSGSHIRITYPSWDDPAAAPVVAVKLQECFGLSQTPRLLGGTCPVTFHLLSPARHPVAVTDDLDSFWAGPYAGVRADMRGRYPKHPWPEDPTTHVATARTKKRM